MIKKRPTSGFRRPRKYCRFTAARATEVDYKDIPLLKNFVTETGRIIPSRLTGTKHYFQRKLTKAIKYARFLALLPYCDSH